MRKLHILAQNYSTMIDHRNRKKKLIISHKNLPEDIRELFKETYPEGYKDYLQKTIKPNGEPIFVVPLETEDTSYMVKFDVVIDTGLVEEDLDKDLYGDDNEGEGDFAPLSEAIEKEEGTSHAVGKMRHGALEEILDGLPEENKKEFEIASADIAAEFGDGSDDDPDDYLDNDDKDEDEDDDIEPDDDELLNIEALLEEADSGEGILREENPPEEKKRGRKKKNESAEIKAVKAVRDEVREASKTTKSSTKKESKTAAAKPAAKPLKAEAKPAKPAKVSKTAVKAAKTTSEKKTSKKK